jgi:hypothetical protein
MDDEYGYGDLTQAAADEERLWRGIAAVALPGDRLAQLDNDENR